MTSHIVRSIKEYNHNQVANAMRQAGYCWRKPWRRPTNIEVMLMHVPRHKLVEILGFLESNK